MASRAHRPVLALSIMALVPAIALGALAVVADGKAAPAAIPTTVATIAPLQPPALATPLLSVRRAPDALADDRRSDMLVAAAGPLAGAVDATSCLSLGLDDQPLVVRNGDVPLIPASNMKVIVAAAALDVLGAGATFTTTVVGPAPVDGVIDGDVYLVGGGDPVLSENWYTQPASGRKRPPMHITDVNALADALSAAGVTRITGDVIGDGSRYDDETFPPGWSSDIRASADGVPVGALVINDSTGRSGGHSEQPAASAADTFVGLLQDRNIDVGGSGTGTAPVGLGVLASSTSAPLTDILNEMLATSDNLTAEMMVKEIGLKVTGRGTRTDGLQAIMDRLTLWQVPTAGVVLTDGSGLSRDNHVTCATMAGVLQHGSATDPVGAAMARGGVEGTTLAGSFQQIGMAGVIQGKTGSLTGVKSLSGYYVMGTDEVEFVLILNGATAGNYAPLWDQLATLLLATATSPAADVLAPAAA